MPNFRASFLLYSQTKAAGIRWHYHESSDCFEYPQNPYLNQAIQKSACQFFLPSSKQNRKKFQTQKNPSIIPVRHLTSGVPLPGRRVIQFINRLNGSETNMITICCWKSDDYLWKAAIINRDAIILVKRVYKLEAREPRVVLARCKVRCAINRFL